MHDLVIHLSAIQCLTFDQIMFGKGLAQFSCIQVLARPCVLHVRAKVIKNMRILVAFGDRYVNNHIKKPEL